MTDALSSEEQVALLALARSEIEETLRGRRAGRKPATPLPQIKAGAFVSLHKHGQLRGCIGTFDTSRPVVEQVRQMAVAAATRDSRFAPMTDAELDAVDIEISVLTPPRRISDPGEINVGEHGLVISRGWKRGVLLPQVATEYGWDRETFLQHTCLKAGLPEDAWTEPETEIQVFSAQVFGEK
jgi:hypothetical protein